MKKLTSTTLFALAVLAAVHAQDTPGITAPAGNKGTVRLNRAPVNSEVLTVHFPQPKVYTLPNGLRVYILEDHRVPGSSFSLLIKAGSLYSSKPVVAEATGSLLEDGTTTKSEKDISRIVDGMGAELSTGAGMEYANISISGLSDYTEPMLDVLVDVALHPVFPQNRLDEYKYRRISQIPNRKSDPDTLAGLLLSQVNYGGSKYARTHAGKDEISAVTLDDLKAYHDAYYRPEGSTLSVTGDVDPDALIKRVRALFDEWKGAGAEINDPPAPFTPATATKVHLIDRPGSKQTILEFTNIGITRTDPDYIPLIVANHILGGGSTGRLFQHIREEKGYTYGAYSDLSTPRWPGTWGAHASVRNEVTGPAAQAFMDEFQHIQDEPVTPEELERAKEVIVGGFALTLQSPDGILGKAMDIVRNNLPADYWDTYPAKIQAVTAEDVQRVARKYLGSNRIQIVAVGERATVEPALSKFGPVQLYDTDIQPIAG